MPGLSPVQFNPDLQLILGRATFAGGMNLNLRIFGLAYTTCPRSSGADLADKEANSPGYVQLYKTQKHVETIDPVFGWRMRVGADSPIAWFVHQGTTPHSIDPVRAKALRFRSRKSGQVVFAGHVNHPGTRPQPWLWRALQEIVRGI